ncbi:type 4a pilus biogenesis protein PilO [Vibrio amylolyticus]|uniref:type 4a pilus biogenesis protein PilO n=1 Tax=Vibrio amylolyticus TaxID=2847292 RepID=UPI00355127C3
MANFQDLELDEITEWPLLPQLFALVVLAILLQAAGGWFYVMPKQERLEVLKEQEDTLKSTLRIKAHKVATLPALRGQLDELQERYDYLMRQLPEQKELASMLASVNESGLKNELTFTRIGWGEKQNQEFLYRLPLNIELTGSYSNIGQFSEDIASLARIIVLEDIEWQRISKESSTLHFRVRAYTYQFKAEVSDEG